ncbi:tRNA(Met) cytidine acetyltransferase [Thiohalocapsa marina]|uniref:tRNA(Met) cytidine acetyltransferase TmcA n=1 Tax=Thiohalocapsa marina TaxID=424902 RepID=A0A5M8FHE9_9GAMM|nr:GNAT family N-acetyltransferase [Thiohalocapsa marina]KAA6184313.1 tRNA(Met) cytidine acetyltransferase [Thiohalocapsa marina]
MDLDRLRQELIDLNQRRLVLLDGPAEAGRAAAEALVQALALPPVQTSAKIAPPQRVHRIGGDTHPDALSSAQAARLLGGECDLLIIDTHHGLDPDALGAAAGTLRGGGLLLLLTPPLARWGRDPAGSAAVSGRFVRRLGRLLLSSPAVVRCPLPAGDTQPQAYVRFVHPAAGSGAAGSDDSDGPDNPTPRPVAPAPAALAAPKTGPMPAPASTPATSDQQQAVEAICKVALGRANRPLVLSSDRGRGKSAALGIAVARLLSDGSPRILVTAPRRAAAEAVFAHARAGHPAAADHLHFLAPDVLLRSRPDADLLLVDEAAGIPAPMLEAMLSRYRRIVFASTVHGYEGTGRGFEIRFRAVLERVTPHWRLLRLRTPIRWAVDDPLERFIHRALLLDAEPAADDQVDAACAPGAPPPRFESVDRDRLAADEGLLRQIFGLLVLGHYQTRPTDLLHMLDGPHMAVAVLHQGDRVLATALSAEEGRLPQPLLAPIFDGQRRPRGHLLPQTLSAHAGLFDAPRLGYTRIVRIAVHPRARRRGFGRQLVQGLIARSRRQGQDLLGASFGATSDLLQFWQRCGLAPVHLGSHRNAASGAHAAVLLHPLSADGRALYTSARARLVPHLGVRLAGPLRDVEPAVVTALLRGAPTRRWSPSADEQRELDAFAYASRGFDAALPTLHRLLLAKLPRTLPLASGADRTAPEQTDLLLACILQQRDWNGVAEQFGLSGKQALLRTLRDGIARLLARIEPLPQRQSPPPPRAET